MNRTSAISIGLSAILGLMAVLASVTLALTVAKGEQGPPGAVSSSTVAPPDSVIQELEARTDYIFCIVQEETILNTAIDAKDGAYLDYLADAITYEAYDEAYDAYSVAYDRYDQNLDECWADYQTVGGTQGRQKN